VSTFAKATADKAVTAENFCGNARPVCLIQIPAFVKISVNTDFIPSSFSAAPGRAL
jgi:hypothetical protein